MSAKGQRRTKRFPSAMSALPRQADQNDIRRERQMDGIKKAHAEFDLVASHCWWMRLIRKMRKAGETVPQIMRQTMLSKASVYRALG